ncbi:MAG: hypothetical protein WC979_06365 [Candidatus Pacearchaeota archaeon]|jgi:hypothetical protein
MGLQKIIFYALLSIEIIGGILLAAINMGFLSNQIIPVICFAIFFFASPFLLILSIIEFIKDKENVILSSIGTIASLGGITIVVIIFMEMTKQL